MRSRRMERLTLSLNIQQEEEEGRDEALIQLEATRGTSRKGQWTMQLKRKNELKNGIGYLQMTHTVKTKSIA